MVAQHSKVAGGGKASAALLQQYGIYSALGCLLLVALVFARPFFQPHNLSDVLLTASILGIVAIGQTYVILGAGIDLSVGAVMSAAMIAAAAVTKGQDARVLPAFLVALLIGVVVGSINGFLITQRNVPPFAATLGMTVLVQGVQFAYTRGIPSGSIPPFLQLLGGGGGQVIPIPLIIVIGVASVAAIALYQTSFGRGLYATGSNREAARLSGIPVSRVTITTYIVSGVLAALAGLLLSGYIGYVDRYVGQGYDLDSIAAVVMGGVSFAGGRGGLGGPLAGALLVTALLNIVLILGLSQQVQDVVKGLAIVAAVALYTVWRRV